MEGLEVGEKIRELKALQMRQALVRIENTMLTEHLSRTVLSRRGSMELLLENVAQEELEKDGLESSPRSSLSSSRGSTPSSARSTVRFTALAAQQPKPPELALPMSMEEKCEIVDEECRFLEQHREKLRSENERSLDDLRAILNHAKMSISEVKRYKSDFGRDVLLLAELNATKKPNSEDILGFIEDKLRRKTHVRDSLREKNERLEAEIGELEAQYAVKEDVKESLHVVDFDRLTILNNELNLNMKERLHAIQSRKGVMKDTLKAMAGPQTELFDVYRKCIGLKNNLRDRTPIVKSTKINITVERAQRMKLHEALIISIQNQEGPPQPTAMEYMRAQDKAGKLWKEITTWENKVEVARLMSQELAKSLSIVRSVTSKA